MFPNSRKNLDMRWVKGQSGNLKGRPRGQNTITSLHRDPTLFWVRHLRWRRFCWALMEPPYTGEAAAIKAGYSRKSARFIASRLIMKPIIHEIRRWHNASVYLLGKTNDKEFSTRGNVIEKKERFDERARQIRQGRIV